MNHGFVLKFRIIPSKPYNRVIGKMNDGTIKIELKAKPLEGQANRELIMFLSQRTHVKKSDISIITGYTSKNKMLQIDSGNKELFLVYLLKD